MKLYVGNVDKSFKGVLLNNAYEYAKCFNGKNRLELISKKSLLDKNNLIIQKYDPNYLFSCLVKENLDREDEKIISIANEYNLISIEILDFYISLRAIYNKNVWYQDQI